MSVAYRQTISDEMAARIERRRGLLSVQEYTTIALAVALDTPTLCELQQQINEAAGVAHSERARAKAHGGYAIILAPAPTYSTRCAGCAGKHRRVMKQPIDKVRISIHPMKDPIPTPDACYVDVEILFDDHWWRWAGRNFHLTPGETASAPKRGQEPKPLR